MKQTIEVEVDVPEGYRLVGCSTVSAGMTYLDNYGDISHWAGEEDSYQRYVIIEKYGPRRRIFECVSEEPRTAGYGEYIQAGNNLIRYDDIEKDSRFENVIWREVTDEREES